MYFLQKDDIMLHFTLSGSSDITGCQCLLSYLLSYLLFCLLGNQLMKVLETILLKYFHNKHMLETNIQNHFFHQFWSKDYCKMAALKEILPYLLSSWIHDLKSWSEILNWLYCRAKEKQLFVAMIYDVNWGGNPPHTSNASEHGLRTPNEASFFHWNPEV